MQRFRDPQAGRGQQQDDGVQGGRPDRAGMPAGPVPQRERAGQQGTHLVSGVDVGWFGWSAARAKRLAGHERGGAAGRQETAEAT